MNKFLCRLNSIPHVLYARLRLDLGEEFDASRESVLGMQREFAAAEAAIKTSLENMDDEKTAMHSGFISYSAEYEAKGRAIQALIDKSAALLRQQLSQTNDVVDGSLRQIRVVFRSEHIYIYIYIYIFFFRGRQRHIF